VSIVIELIKKIPGLRSRIGRKLMIYILLFSSMITFLGTGLQLYLDFNHDLKSIHNTLQQIESSNLYSITNSLWVTDEESLQIQLEGILRLPDMKFVEIRKGKNILHSVGIPQVKNTIEKTYPLVFVYNGRNIDLGELHVVTSLKDVYARIFDRILVILSVQTIKTFLVSLFIFIIFYQLVGKHIISMATWAKLMRFESMDQPIQMDRKSDSKNSDELDQLAKSFNQMKKNLNNSYHTLKKTNLNLKIEINDRIRLEKKLTESEKRFRQLAENISAVFWIISPDYKEIYYISPAYEKVWGRTCESLYKNPISWFEAIFPDDRGLVEAYIEQIGQSKSSEEIKFPEYRVIRPDGVICWISARGFPVRNDSGEIYRIVGIAENISDRKQAEDLLNKFFRLSLDLFCIADLKGCLKHVNPAFEKILGYTEAEVLGKSYIEFVHPDDRAATSKISKELVTGVPAISFENRYLTKNGQYIWLSWTTMPDPPEGLTYAVARDITAEKDALKEKLKIEAELQHTQKMETIGTLAGGVAHDFNNILFPIVGHAEMLIEDVPEDSPFRDSLKEIYTSALRAKDLVKQILTFSRQEKSELKLMKMQPIIKEALKLIRSTIPTTIEIKQDINADCGVIKADPTQIHQIVMNLSTNAYHAMEDNGGELQISLKEIKFEKLDLINTDIEPGIYACLTIADTGVGMNKNLTKKIFDPFFTTKKQGKGTGMGLSVVHGIVMRMNGAIQVYSEPEKGTQFHVYLPLEKGLSEKQVTYSKAKIQGGTEQILLVDDEEAILTMEKRMLERLGYKVTARTSSLEALGSFRDSPDKFDLVITDMAMPNMPGDELSVELNKIHPDIPVLLCTGFSETLSKEKAASLGIKGFLLKPIVMKDIAQKIRELLDGP
jgi:PAS domain S-box-containing protein